jgi:hypothetical protein
LPDAKVRRGRTSIAAKLSRLDRWEFEGCVTSLGTTTHAAGMRCRARALRRARYELGDTWTSPSRKHGKKAGLNTAKTGPWTESPQPGSGRVALASFRAHSELSFSILASGHDRRGEEHERGAGDDAAEDALGHVVAEHVGDAAAGWCQCPARSSGPGRAAPASAPPSRGVRATRRCPGTCDPR